jgi:hypothetical protein
MKHYFFFIATFDEDRIARVLDGSELESEGEIIEGKRKKFV